LRLINYLKAQGKKVLDTREPGTPHYPLTMTMRKYMLDAEYNVPDEARELISQTIRSIHMTRVVEPALYEYDYIIQNRGILSAITYGEGCGHNIDDLIFLCKFALGKYNQGKLHNVYDRVIILLGDPEVCLRRAQLAKQEFQAGDAMELKGLTLQKRVKENMMQYGKLLGSVPETVSFINIDNLDEDSVEKSIREVLKI